MCWITTGSFLALFFERILADEMRKTWNLTHLGSLEDVDKGVAPHQGDFPEHVGLEGIHARQCITGVDQGIRMALGPVISSQYFISPYTPLIACTAVLQVFMDISAYMGKAQAQTEQSFHV